METIRARVLTRLSSDNVQPEIGLIDELIQTAIDRINLRVGDIILNPLLYSIAVEVVIKMYRRVYFEGIKNETADGFRVDYIEDILKEYEVDFNKYISSKDGEDDGRTFIKFL